MGAGFRSGLPRLLALGLLMEAGFAGLGLPGVPIPVRIALQMAIFAVYLIGIRLAALAPVSLRDLRAALALAALFRVTLLFAPPFYSDDMYRYLWDGHVQVDGHLNPYLHAPDAAPLVPLRGDLFSRVNHPDIPTLYPPVAEAFFATVVLASRSVPVMKGAMALLDLTLIGVLLQLLTRVGLPREQVLIYAWSPLVVAEVAGNGHVDVLAVLLLVAGILLERPLLSTAALGLSIASKFLSLLTFPVLSRRWRARFWAVPILVVALAYLPYAPAEAALFRGLRAYALRWQHNDSLFTPLLGFLEWIRPTPPLKAGIARLNSMLGYLGWVEVLYSYAYPVYLARLLSLGIAAVLASLLAWKRVDPVRGSFLVIGAVLLLSPTVYPWYLLWIVPFLALRPNRAWILLTGLVPLSYLDPGPLLDGLSGRPWVRWVEYSPFFALLLWDAVTSSHRGSPITLFGLPQFSPAPAGRGVDTQMAGNPPSS